MTLATAALLVGSATAFTMQGSLRPASRSSVQPTMAAALTAPLSSDIWSMARPVRVEGKTLKTWDIGDEGIQRVQLSIKSEGRPVYSDVQLWHTPAYIPAKFSVYSEDGNLRPVHAIIETPKHPKTVAVYNTAPQEFAFDATVANTGMERAYESLKAEEPEMIQGANTIRSYTFGPEVESVQVLLMTADLGGRNMKAKIELTQGPNQIKQTIELYASAGYKNPFYVVIQTPGPVNTVRVINQNTVEFPLDAWVKPYESVSAAEAMMPVIGGM